LLLQYEIEVCFKEIFFKILANKGSTAQQKILVLDLLKKICGNTQKLMDIFINYDCDPEALDSNIFERMVTDLSKVAQMKIELDPQLGALPEDLKLKAFGLDCLGEIFSSMVNWCREKDDSAEPGKVLLLILSSLTSKDTSPYSSRGDHRKRKRHASSSEARPISD